ncbi:MAG: glutamate 5-kinase [Microbacteriaceae bacterium]|jgi:glutamate 5-kinase|nr:glutamate 5-kinase [Microbacteriaceae bacterium]MCI1207133.1 glutamate 5-kinase [Microbacteriaceae bacterium]
MTLQRIEDLAEARRLVVKVGSSSITGENAFQLPVIAHALAALRQRGIDVVLVSSGAIATGMPLLKLAGRPRDLATSQAAASVGQSRLMYRYEQVFNEYDIVVSQVLLTAFDLEDRSHRANALRALDRLLQLGAVPIVNENDTVATNEIRFGDNDRLAALVAVLVRADALLLLSDVPGLFTAPPDTPGARLISTVRHGDALESVRFGGAVDTGVGTGGALTKVAAARVAADAGVPVFLTQAMGIAEALRGAAHGTWFEAWTPDDAGLTVTGAIQTIDEATHGASAGGR